MSEITDTAAERKRLAAIRDEIAPVRRSFILTAANRKSLLIHRTVETAVEAGADLLTRAEKAEAALQRVVDAAWNEAVTACANQMVVYWPHKATPEMRDSILALKRPGGQAMSDAPERIWIEAGDDCPYFYEEHELHEAGGPMTEYIRADMLDAKDAEIDRLREATEHVAGAAKGMSAEVALGDGAIATIIDPRSFADGGPEWVMRYGSPCSIRFVVASLLESYDGLLSDNITAREAVRRLRLMRSARAALRSTEARHDD